MLRPKEYILAIVLGLLAFGFFHDRSYTPEEIKAIRISAEQGDVDAQLEFGQMYFSGKTLDQNYHKARFWFEHAASQENAQSQYNLGLIYEDGLGVAIDLELARYWYMMACNNPKRVNKACDKLSNFK